MDVRQLRFLGALIRTRSITLAGEATGLSQPTASRTYRRLKSALADPLLVRVGSVAVLTPFAESLERHVDAAIQAIEAIFMGVPFDPEVTRLIFNVAASDFVSAEATWSAISQLRRQAPTSSVRIHGWNVETIGQLERGGLDLAIHAAPALPPEFHSRSLSKDMYALVCPASHPLATGHWASAAQLLEAAARHPHFGLHIADAHGHSTRNLYAEAGVAPPPLAFDSGKLVARPQAVLGDELVALMPGRLAREWVSDTAYAVVPIHDPRLSIEYRLIWHERVHRDPANAWARGVIQQAFGVAGPRFPVGPRTAPRAAAPRARDASPFSRPESHDCPG